MTDTITIKNLEVWTFIGVPDEERAQQQKLEITVTFSLETLHQAALTDDVNFTINYYNVAQRIKYVAGLRERKLIETLAEELTRDLLKQFELKKIELEIRKFIIPDCRYISLKISRSKESY